MVRVPTVSARPVDGPALQAPQIQPVQNFAPQQMEQLGQGMQRAGQAAIRIGDDLQDRINDTIAMQKFNNFREGLLGAAMNKDGGFLTTQGENALKGYSSARKTIDELYKAQADTLENDTQRMIFEQQASLFRGEYISRLDQHTYKEHKNFYVKELGRKAEGLWQDWSNALANPQGPGVTADNRKIQPDALQKAAENALSELLNEQGIPLDSAIAQNAMSVAKDAGIKTAVLSLLDGNQFETASQTFEKYQGQMSEQARSEVSKRIAEKQDDRSAVMFAESIRQRYSGDLLAQQQALTRALQAADQPLTYQQYKTAMAHIAQVDNIEQTALNRQRTDLLQGAINGAIGSAALTIDDYLPKSEQQKMRDLGIFDQFNDWWNSGKRNVTNNAVYGFMSNQPESYWAKQDPVAFQAKYLTSLSSDDMKWALGKIKVAQGKASDDDVAVTKLRAFTDYQLNNQPWSLQFDAAVADMAPGERTFANDTRSRWQENFRLSVQQALAAQDEQTRRSPMDVRIKAAIDAVDDPSERVFVKFRNKDYLVPKAILSATELQDPSTTVQIAGKQVPYAELPNPVSVSANLPSVAEYERNQKLMADYPGSVPYDFAEKQLGIPQDVILKVPQYMRPGNQLSVAAIVDYLRSKRVDLDPEATPAQKEWVNGAPEWYRYQTARPSYLDIRRSGL